MEKYFKFSVNEIIILSLLFFNYGYWYYHIVNVFGVSLWNILVVIIILTLSVRVWISTKAVKE